MSEKAIKDRGHTLKNDIAKMDAFVKYYIKKQGNMDCKKPQGTCNFQCWGRVSLLNAICEDILLMPPKKTFQ